MAFSGSYKGKILRRAIRKSKNGAIQFNVQVELTQKLVKDKYEDIAKDASVDYKVWGSLTLINCDGSINGAQTNSLKESLHWNGASLKELNEIDIIGKEYPVSLSIEDGKSRIDWINSSSGSNLDLDEIDQNWKNKIASVEDFG